MANGPLWVRDLTGHSLTIDTAPVTPDPDLHTATAAATLPATGQSAPFVQNQTNSGALNTVRGWIRRVSLRRSCHVVRLPAPRPGTAFVLPQLAPGTGNRDVDHHATRHVGLTVTGSTALIGRAPGNLPEAIGGDPDARDYWPMCATAAVLLMLGCGLPTRAWWLRYPVATRHGTADMLDEQSKQWTDEEKRSILRDLASYLASVLHVTRPADLGDDWDWPLTDGAEHWDEHVDVLVRLFWSVQFNDDRVTHNALSVWAWWPVALAFAARATETAPRAVHLNVTPTQAAQANPACREVRPHRAVTPPTSHQPLGPDQTVGMGPDQLVAVGTSQTVGGTVILGMLAPQEVHMGIGVLAAGRPRRLWPETLWPIQFRESGGVHRPVIPGLNLGYQGLRPGPVR